MQRSLKIKEGRNVRRTLSDGQKSHNFCDFAQAQSTAHC